MAEPRVEAVIDGVVVVTGDPDGLIGALIAALLVDDRDALHVLVHGTQESIQIAGLQVRRFRNAIDLLRAGAAPSWTLARGAASAALAGDAIERLFDQAHEHRRMAQRSSFPVGGTLCGGRYTITETPRGTPDRGMYRARSADGTYVVTLGPPQQRGLGELRAELALRRAGIAELVELGPLEPRAERFWITGQPRSYGVPPCFDQFFHAPEVLADRSRRRRAAAMCFAGRDARALVGR